LTATATERPVAVICRSTHSARCGLGAASALLLIVTALLTWFFAMDGWNAPMAVMALGMAAITTAAGLITAASIWNTVRVQIIAGDVVVASGPVPWPRRRLISGATIEQLYVQQAPLARAFIPRLGGPFDLQARLRDGRWITVVRGCRSPEDAQRAERLIESALDRTDEFSDLDEDDERSEVFKCWRESLGPRPAWIAVDREGDRVRVTCRKPRSVVWKNAAVVGIGVGLSAIGLQQPQVNDLAAVVLALIIATLLLRLASVLMWRSDLLIDGAEVVRSTRGLLGRSRPKSIDRRLVEALDCRSRTFVQRVGKSGRRHARRYQIVAHNDELGLYRLTEHLDSRNDAFHVMKEAAEALGVDARATRWADDEGE